MIGSLPLLLFSELKYSHLLGSKKYLTRKIVIMEIEFFTSSPWSVGLSIVMFVFLIGTCMSLILTTAGHLKLKIGLIAFLISALAFTGSVIGYNVVSDAVRKSAEATFNQKLMEEYGATSSRSILDMNNDFYKYNEATTTFTRDGVDTTVFVKRVSNDDNKLKMVFTVVDAKSLYPKSGK